MRRPQAWVIHQAFGSGSTDEPVCSFCGRKRTDGNRRFIAGLDGVYICDECIDLCVEILEEERRD